MQKKVLAAILQKRDAYEKLARLLTKDDFSEDAFAIYELSKQQYERDKELKQVDTELLCDRIQKEYPKHGDLLVKVVKDLQNVSVPNVMAAFLEHKKDISGNQLADALLTGKRTDLPTLLEEYSKYQEATTEIFEEDDDVYINVPLADVTAVFSSERLLRLHPRTLNERCDGGVPEGTHILVYAPPEHGKSLFTINLAAGVARDGHKVLFIENEDPYANTLIRVYSRLTGRRKAEILKDVQGTEELAKAKGFDNFILASLAPGSMYDIRRYIEKFSPRLVVINQLHNLRGPNLPKVEKLEYLATEARNLAKAYNIVVVSVTQAGDSAYGKPCLELGDVYGSNTAIQAAVDIMIGIGMDKNMEAMNKRMLSLPKNKISGNHESLIVDIDPSLSKMVSS